MPWAVTSVAITTALGPCARVPWGLVVGLLFFTRHASRAHDLAVDEFFPGEEGS